MKALRILVILFLLAAANADATDVTVTIPDAEATRVLNAIASQQGYTGLNPQGGAETKAQFAKRMLRNWIIAQVKAAEGNAAADSARSTANTSVDSIGIN
jgi:hypothetical protein